MYITESDTIAAYTYQLQSKFAYPYCGIKFHLTPSATTGIDLSKYDSIHIAITMSNSNAIRVFLKSYDPMITDTLKPNTYWYHEKEFIPSKHPGIASFSLNDFTISIWWKLLQNLQETRRTDKLKSVNHIEFLNGLSTSPSIDSVHVAIAKIFFTGKNRVVQTVVLSINGLFWVITVLSFLFYFIRMKAESRRLKAIKSIVLSSYKKVISKSDEELKWDRIVQFVSENYSDPDLNIEMIAQKTGINPKELSTLFRKFYNTNFKGYLNDLRLTEAARLLKETSKQITEIAFSVGYNNISHFSRIFKEKYTVSPKDFREMQ